MIDKEEVSMIFQVPVHTGDANISPNTPIKDEQIFIENDSDSVSKTQIAFQNRTSVWQSENSQNPCSTRSFVL